MNSFKTNSCYLPSHLPGAATPESEFLDPMRPCGLAELGPYKTRISTHRHLDTSVLFSMQIEYWILTCKALDPMSAISAYSAIFSPSSAAI